MEESPDSRMEYYMQQEQDFLHYANTTSQKLSFDNLRSLIESSKHNSHGCHGLQCLLALTRLLEETCRHSMCSSYIHQVEKDGFSLDELRKHAEKLFGACERKNPPTGAAGGIVNAAHHLSTSSHGAEDPESYSPPYRARSVDDLLSIDHSENLHNDSLRSKIHKPTGGFGIGTTIDKMKVKLLKTKDSTTSQGTHGQSPHSTLQRRTRAAADFGSTGSMPGIHALVHSSSSSLLRTNSSFKYLTLPSKARRTNSLHQPRQPDLDPEDAESGFTQYQLVTPPTPQDLGGVWLGTFSSTLTTTAENISELLAEGAISTSPLSSPQAVMDSISYSAKTQSVILPAQSPEVDDPDRCASLPAMVKPPEVHKSRPNNGKGLANTKPAYKTSYEEAVKAGAIKKKHYPDITEQIVNEARSHQTVDKEYLDTLDQVNVSKGFAKKFQKWVNQQEHKDLKSKQQKKTKGYRGPHRQRSLSADRASKPSPEFVERLREWGIKQGLDPDYYKNSISGTRSSLNGQDPFVTKSEESLQSDCVPADNESSYNHDTEERIAKPGVIKRSSVSLERGRRVSPHQVHRRISRRGVPEGQLTASSSTDSSGFSSASSYSEKITVGKSAESINQDSKELPTILSEGSLQTHTLVGPTWSASSDIYAKETEKTLESHSSLANTFSSEQSSLPRAATSRSNSSNSTKSTHAQAVLKDINEDLDRLRLNMRRVSSSSTRLHTSLSSQKSDTLSPTDPEPQIICYDDEDNRETFESAPFNVAYEYAEPLPKHSVCVDSGLAMEGDTFCSAEAEDTEEKLNGSLPDSFDGRRKLIRTSNVAEHEDTSGDLHLPEHNLNDYLQDVPTDTGNTNDTQKMDDNWNVTTAIINSDMKTTSLNVNGVTDKPELNNIPYNREDNSSLACNEPIDSLLGSKTVNLKTKLKCLADLYTTEDTEQTNNSHISHELPYPYNVFNNNSKAPTSELGPTVKSPTQSSKMQSSSLSNFLREKATQNKKTKGIEHNRVSHVPIHDLVTKFDKQSTTVPLRSNKAEVESNSANNRYTLDLNKLRRDIGRQDQFKKARSVFMDHDEVDSDN